jgi:chromosome segregation ATPase
MAAKAGLSDIQTVLILKEEGLTQAQVDEVMASYQTTVATEADTVAKTGNITVTNVLAGSIAKLNAIIVANPILATIAITGAALLALNAAYKAYQKHIENIQKALSDSVSNYESVNQEVKSLNGQLASTQDKMTQLEKAKGIKNLVDDDEYQSLVETNNELERTLTLKKEEQRLAAIDSAKAATKALNTKVRSKYVEDMSTYDPMSGMGGKAKVTPVEELNAAIKEGNQLVEKRNKLETEWGNLSDKEKQNPEIAKKYDNSIKSVNDALTETRTRAKEMGDIVGKADTAYSNLTSDGEKLSSSDQTLADSVNDADTKYANFIKTLDSATDKIDETAKKTDNLSKGVPTSEIIDSIATLKTGFSSLGDAFNEFKKNGVVASDTLSGLNDTFGKMDGYENFLNVLGDSKSTLPEVTDAVSSLATEYLASQDALGDCTDADKELMASQLKSIGVMNAEELVSGNLADKIAALKAQKILAANPDFANMTETERQALLKEVGASDSVSNALYALSLEKIANGKTNVIDLTLNEASALYAAAKGAGVYGQALEAAAHAQMVLAGKGDALAPKSKALLEKLANQNISDVITVPKIKLDVPHLGGISTPKSSKSSTPKSSTSSASSKIEPYKAEIDTLKDLEDAYDAITLAVSRNEIAQKAAEGDTTKQLTLNKQKVDLLQQEQKALNNLNNARRKLISNNVSKLSSLGFNVSYDSTNNNLQIKNLKHLNELKGKDTEATNNLIKETESLINTTESLNKKNVDASTQWATLANNISDLKNENFADEINKWESSLDGLTKRNSEIDFKISLLEDNDYDQKISLLNDKMRNAKTVASSYKNEIDTLNATTDNAYKSTSYYSEQIDSLTEKYRDAATNAFEYEKSIRETIKAQKQADLNRYTQQKSDVNDLIDMVKELIQQESDDEVDALQDVSDGYQKQIDLLDDKIDKLNDEKDAYKDIINAQKESLELQKNQHSESEQISKYNKNIADIQNQLDSVSNDTSREGIQKKQELEEKLADAQVELQDYVYDKNVEKQEDALDTEYSLYENSVNKKIDALKEEQTAYNKMINNIKSKMTSIQDKISNDTELTQQAIDMIDNDSGNLYDKLIDWNDKYGTSIDEDVISTWDKAQDVLDNYSDTMQGLVDLTKEMNSLQSDVDSMDNDNYDYSDYDKPSSKNNRSNNSEDNSANSNEKIGVRKFLVSKGFKVDWNDDTKQILVDDKAYNNTRMFDNRDGTLYGTKDQIYQMLNSLGLGRGRYQGSFDTGGTIVDDGWAKVHKDETILTAQNSKDFSNLLETLQNDYYKTFINSISEIPKYDNVSNLDNSSIEISYDNMINVQGSIDKDNVTEVKNAVQEGITQLKQDLARQYKRNGITSNVKNYLI